MGAGTASTWVASYWGAMTVGRLWLGLAGHRLAPGRVLAASSAGALVGTALLTADVAAGLPVLGASLASIFPTLVLVTPSRVGGERAAGATGWQMAAAGAGGAAGPAAVGLVLERAGVDAYGPALLVLALLLAVVIATPTAQLQGDLWRSAFEYHPGRSQAGDRHLTSTTSGTTSIGAGAPHSVASQPSPC